MASLFEQHKAERRSRILAAARRLIARRGFAGLTMRDLAEEARVSVPTVYNLIGGKHELLAALLEQIFGDIAAGVAQAPGDGAVERLLAMLAAGHDALLAAPRYARGLVNVFLASEDERELRRHADQAYVGLLAAEVARGQSEGTLASYVDPLPLAASIYTTHMATTIAWAKGDLDDDGWRDASSLGCCLALLGLTHGHERERLQRRLQEVQARCHERLVARAMGHETARARPARARHGGAT